MKTLVVLAGLLTALPAGALACSYPPVEVPEPSAEERERRRVAQVRRFEEGLRRAYVQSEAVVEILALSAARPDLPGRVRVIHSYKGNVARGRILDMRLPIPTSCGGGPNLAAGSRGVVILPSLARPIHFGGYLSRAQLAMLRRDGLLGPGRRR